MTGYKLTGGVLLFAASFFLYSFASPGNLPGDTEVRWSVARQIVRARGVSLEESLQTNNYAIGAGGKRYSFYGLGQSICLLPFAAIGLAIEKAGGVDAKVADLTGQFLASVILFAAIGASLVWLFYKLVISLGYNGKTAILLSAVFAFATMNFHYSVNTQEQTQVALLLVLAIFLMVRYYQEHRFVYAWLFCVALGMCLIFRMTSAVMIFPVYLIAVVNEVFRSGRKDILKIIAKWFLAGALGTGGFIIACGWYNYIRFGNVFESGYGLVADTFLGGHKLFESPPLPTLAAMLFSPGKSIFLYNPVLLLLPLCVYGFYHRHKVVALTVFSAILSDFAFHSFFTAWAGDYAWSIRYQVPLLAFLVLPLVVLFSKPLKTLAKIFIVSLILVSCVIQVASVVYNFNLEFVQNPNHCIIPDDWVWDRPQSHLQMRFENIIRHIAGKQDFSSVKVINEEPLLLKSNRTEESVRTAYSLNFFPFKAKGMLPSNSKMLFYPLLCLWLVLGMGFCLSAVGLIRFYAGRKTDGG
jgi:hypothetical protein